MTLHLSPGVSQVCKDSLLEEGLLQASSLQPCALHINLFINSFNIIQHLENVGYMQNWVRKYHFISNNWVTQFKESKS